MQPIEVWDAGSPEWADRFVGERSAWVDEHLGRAVVTTRVEFFLIDAPFAKAYRFALDASGRPFLGPDGEPAMEDAVEQLLDALPPAHLLVGAR